MTIDLDRAVLLPIDMQLAFDTPPWPRRWNEKVDPNGLALLDFWRAAGRTIIHVRHDSVQPGSSLAPGSPGNAFRPGFEPLAGEQLVTKSVNSAFIGTDLDIRLKRLNAKHVVTFGISTDMCVSTTVRTGANMGWDMILVPDACDCFDLPDGQGGIVSAEDVQRAHVATLGFEFARIMNTAELTNLRAAA
ncbi:cysteine hydrolase family protein [Sphingomonas daechungensis]|uniref:cysteine hydrolase family protein n=1 Tax=Sphingomonas daechungensis TaxID=1176646 RepID=UPI003783284A